MTQETSVGMQSCGWIWRSRNEQKFSAPQVFLTWCVDFSSVQSLSCVRLFATQWTAARQASLSITKSKSLPRLMSIESVMPSNHLCGFEGLYLRLPLTESIFLHQEGRRQILVVLAICGTDSNYREIMLHMIVISVSKYYYSLLL